MISIKPENDGSVVFEVISTRKDRCIVLKTDVVYCILLLQHQRLVTKIQEK